MRHPFLLIGFVVAISSIAGSVHADTNDGANQPPLTQEKARDLSVRAGPGVFVGPTPGVTLELEGLGRSGIFVAGVLGTIGSAAFDYTYLAIGPTGGISLPLPRWARVDILGTIGVHSYTHVGKGSF